jgi:alkylation response protein AidB-like acyl-CoA dehydrogenase
MSCSSIWSRIAVSVCRGNDVNFELSEEQQALLGALQAILKDHAELPQHARLASHYFDTGLQRALDDNGFLEAGREFGALAAALVVEECARLGPLAEVAAAALILPALDGAPRLPGPIALIDARDLHLAQRHLPVARTALVDLGRDVAVVVVRAEEVESVPSVYAYPFGRFLRPPDLAAARYLTGQGELFRQWRRVALAAEFAGAAQSALDLAVTHVKERQVFGHPVASFQTVQHRLVQCQIAVTGVRYLALRAAWSGESYHADLAACYAQQHVRKLLCDLHQFTGAMGVTHEYPLHLWTYRLRALQSEVGGLAGAASGVARHRWPGTPAEAPV